MKKVKLNHIVILGSCFIQLVFAQIGVKNSFKLAQEASANSSVDNVFLGNGIIDLLVNGDEVWAATGYGLNKSVNEGNEWQTFDSDADMPPLAL